MRLRLIRSMESNIIPTYVESITQVTAETAQLLRHWRSHEFETIRPFFCQVEAVETAIWLSEVLFKMGKRKIIFYFKT